jgi:hypothetical protein
MVLIFLIGVDQIKKTDFIVKNIVASVFILGTSIFGYFILNKYFQYKITPAYGYIDGYIGWNKGLDSWKVMMTVYEHIKFILLGKYDQSGVVLLVSLVVFILFIFIKTIYLSGILKKIFVPLLALCFIISPFILMLGLGTILPGRALQALPLLLGGMWYLMLKYPIEDISNKFLIAISIYLLFIQIQFINLMFYGDYVRYQQDSFIGREIMMSLKANNVNYKKKPLVFIGKLEKDMSPLISKSNSGGLSFFENPFMDKNQMYRMTFFLNSLGYDVITPSYEEMEIGRKDTLKMKIWPLDGSIIETDSLIKIKLSEE